MIRDNAVTTAAVVEVGNYLIIPILLSDDDVEA